MPLVYDQHYHPVNFMKITTEERDALDYPDDGTVIFNISNMRNEVLQQGVWVPVTPFNYTDPDWFETLTIVDGEITITGSGVYMISPESGDYDVLTYIHGGQLGDRIVLLPAPIGGASPACILLDQSGIGDGDGLMGPTTQQAQLFTNALAPTTSIGSMGLELAKGLFFGWETWFVLGTEGLPLTTNLLVGTANAGYPDLIVVGTTPGGELGGTWASPTVDATHSGSAHHTRSHAIAGASDHTGTADRVIYVDHAGAVIELALGADGTYFKSNGATSAPSFATPAGGGAMATDPLWDALGDLAYGTGADTGAKLAGNITTTKKFLSQTGDGAASAIPGWVTIAAGDIPLLTNLGVTNAAAIGTGAAIPSAVTPTLLLRNPDTLSTSTYTFLELGRGAAGPLTVAYTNAIITLLNCAPARITGDTTARQLNRVTGLSFNPQVSNCQVTEYYGINLSCALPNVLIGAWRGLYVATLAGAFAPRTGSGSFIGIDVANIANGFTSLTGSAIGLRIASPTPASGVGPNYSLQTTGTLASKFGGEVVASKFTQGDLKCVGSNVAEVEVRRTQKDYVADHAGSGNMVLSPCDHTNAADVEYMVEIDLAGTGIGELGDAGNATFRWSNDDGATWEVEDIELSLNTQTYSLGNGIIIDFHDGTFVLGDHWTWTAIGTANQVYTLRCDTINNKTYVGSRLIIAGDESFYLDYAPTTTDPRWTVATTGHFRYVRADDKWQFFAGSTTPVLTIADTALTLSNGTSLAVDHVNESFADHGVNVDGVLIKDGLVDGVDVSALGTRTIYGSFYARPESTTVPKLIIGPMDCAGTFLKLTIKSYEVAAESAIRVDLHKQTAANEDSNTSTTVFTTQTNRPTIAAASYAGHTDTFEVSTFADGDWLYFFLDVDDSGITVINFSLKFTPG